MHGSMNIKKKGQQVVWRQKLTV